MASLDNVSLCLVLICPPPPVSSPGPLPAASSFPCILQSAVPSALMHAVHSFLHFFFSRKISSSPLMIHFLLSGRICMHARVCTHTHVHSNTHIFTCTHHFKCSFHVGEKTHGIIVCLSLAYFP